WSTNEYMGDTSPGLVSPAVDGLDPGTTYYYRGFASNRLGEAWAPAATNFTTSYAFVLGSDPPGREIVIDTVPTNATVTNYWLPGTVHTLAVVQAVQAEGAGTQHVFDAWSDGGGRAHSVTAAGITARFTTQYQWSWEAQPAAGGTVTPPSGDWYGTGATFTASAAANPNYAFSGWSGDISGTESNHSVTMTGAVDAVAHFDVHIIPGIRYVDRDARGAGDGSSWRDAFTGVQSALSMAVSNDQIWVAEGVYVPGASAMSTFHLRPWVSLYGGFAGNEDNLDDRNWAVHLSVLSGDVDGDDAPAFGNRTDNAETVVMGANNAVMDGLVIRGGNAARLGAYWYQATDAGGGMFSVDANPTVRNCVFVDNRATTEGGGVYANHCSPVYENCVFVDNRTSGNAESRSGAAGVHLNGAAPVFRRSVFCGNVSEGEGYGGGVTCLEKVNTRPDYQCTIQFTNCLFAGNYSHKDVGGMYPGAGSVELHWTYGPAPSFVNCTFSAHNTTAFVQTRSTVAPVVRNCIFWGDLVEIADHAPPQGTPAVSPTYCDINQGDYAGGEGCIMTDPRWAPGTNGTWTADGVYDPNTGVSTLTDSAALWFPNRYAGCTVNPDTGQAEGVHLYILGNSRSTMRVWGDASAARGFADSGDDYRVFDYHLRGTNSPCADTASPSNSPPVDLDGIERPQFGGYDMGAYEYAIPEPIHLPALLLIVR
ncbi:choice-of-anchor Q domain-containing protein, partial [Verrucomicrobiota bacterium]